MKTITMRLISLIVMIMMLITSIPFYASANAEIDKLCLYVSETVGFPGSTVDVEISIKNNPGLASLKFDVEYGDYLTLERVSFNSQFGVNVTAPMPYTNPQTLSCVSPLEEINAEGVFATLSFAVDEDAPNNYVSNIAISYKPNDICDGDLVNIETDVINGKVTICHRKPGDVNGDESVDNKDAILVFRHAAGWNVDLDETDKEWMDVNADFFKDNKDAILIFRYSAGWSVQLLPPPIKHTHDLTAIPAKDATCTEDGNISYWKCEKCEKYFSDATGKNEIASAGIVLKAHGHTSETIPGKAATYNETGLTEGSKCSVCQKILVQQEIIPKLIKDSYTIQYMNELVPSTNKDYYLQNDITDHFHYTVGVEKALPTPKLDKYTFIGWSDENGELVGGNGKVLPKETTGDVVLYANWVSNRNKAKPIKKLEKPDIFEDPEDNLIMFVYKIGTVENIPLYTTLNLQCVNGIITTVSETKQTSIKIGNAQSVASTIENITSGSSSWTLSEDWNKTTQISKDNTFTTDEERVNAEKYAKTERGTYRIGASYSDFESETDSSGSTVRLSDNKSHVDYNEKEKNKSFGLSVDAKLSNTTELKLGAKVGAKLPSVATAALTGIPADVSGEVEAGIKNTNTFEIGGGADYKTSTRDFETHTDSWSKSIDINEESAHVETSEKTWNFSNSFEKSTDISRENTISRAVSQGLSISSGIKDETTVGGGKTTSEEFASSDKTGLTTGSVISFDKEEIITEKHSFQSNGNTFGSYRMVMAGSADVYAVVCYDMMTGTYFVYTYNVANKETKEYLDYSAVDDNFNDYEYSIIPFEIPSEVNDYVNARMLQTSGLKINPTTGIVTEYEPYDKDNPDTIVIIPTYWRYYDTKNNKYHVIEVKGIAPDLFKGHTEIVGVQLGAGIKEIPASAFEGCTSLKGIYCPGVTKIGDYAFKGCTALESFTIPHEITSVGHNAFEGVQKLTAYAVNEEVEKAVIDSGAKQIIIDISKLSDVKDISISIDSDTELFELNGVGKTFEGLTIVSDAVQTELNGITITGDTFTPLKTGSGTLVLDHTSIESDGIAVVLKNPSTRIIVNNQNEINSRSGKAIICGDASLEEVQSNIVGTIVVTGDVLTCGTITGEKHLNFASGQIVPITETEYENYKKGMVRVTFNGNGGTVDTAQADVVYGLSFGDKLPETAVRTGYTFAGWYTEADGGEKITSDTPVNQEEDFTLFAHWNANAYTISFNVNANGAAVSESSKIVTYDDIYGALPTPTLAGTTFVGWYTEESGGERVLSDTKVKITADQTLYAHWSRNTYTVSFDSNGGSASYGSKTVTYAGTYGDLPAASRDYYDFLGWFTEAEGGSQIASSTEFMLTHDVTLYAHWQQHGVSGWVRASELPTGAEVTNRKYSYTQTYYTSQRGSSYIEGWTHYNTERTDWGSTQGPVYSDPSNGERNVWSESYVSSYAQKTQYRYSRWLNQAGSQGKNSTNGARCFPYKAGYCSYGPYYSEWSDTPYRKRTKWDPSWGSGYSGYCYGTPTSNYDNLGLEWYNEETRTVDDTTKPNYSTRWYYQDPVYTYYFYRNENLESSSYPSGNNVSNIQEWVQYRAK